MIQSLLNRSNAAGIFAFDDVYDLLWKSQLFFLDDFFILNDINGDVVVNEAKDIQIQIFNRTFYLDNILLPILLLRAF